MRNYRATGVKRTTVKPGFLGWGYVLGLSMAAMATPVRADTVNLDYAGQGAGRVVRVSLGSQSWDMFAGRIMHTASSGNGLMTAAPHNIVTFCVDILQAHTTSPSSYNTSSVATLSGNTGLTNLGFGKQQAIYDLYHAAANLQFTAGSDCAAAFQVALWEVVYDYNPNLPNHGLNASGGNFRAAMQGQSTLSPSVTGALEYLLGSVGSGAAANHLVGLRSNQFQDQLFVADQLVPLPPAAWAGLCGLGLVIAGRSRRRRA